MHSSKLMAIMLACRARNCNSGSKLKLRAFGLETCLRLLTQCALLPMFTTTAQCPNAHCPPGRMRYIMDISCIYHAYAKCAIAT